jgi:DNA primase
LWEKEVALEPLDTPERRAGFEVRLDEAIARIENEVVRSAYARELKDRRYQYFRNMRFAGSQNQTKYTSNVKPTQRVKLVDTRALAGRSGLGLIVKAIDSPNLIEEAGETLAMANFRDEDVSALRNAALDVQDFAEKLDREAIASHLRSLGRTRSAKLLEEYPRTEPIDLSMEQGREWLIALERFPTVAALKDEADATKDAFASANGVEERVDEWERRKRLVAERQALKAQSQDLIDNSTSNNSQD